MEEIFLKIALAESDGAFESVVGKYLPQVIESLKTNQQKALEIITHVKKRVTSRPEVKLPLAELMELFEKSDFQPVKTFALLFIKLGIRRESELNQLTKFLVKCLFLAPKNAIFFSLFSQNLHQIFSGLSKRDDLVARVKSFLESARYNESVSWLPGLLSHSTAVLCLKENSSACLSTIEIDQLQRSRTNPLTNQPEVSSEQIQMEKKSLAQLFINWSFFERHYENKLSSIHLIKILNLINFEFSGLADGALKQLDYDLENDEFINSIYRFYLGELAPIQNPKMKHQLAPERVRIHLVSYLLKSKTAASKFPHSLQVTFDLLRDNGPRGSMALGFDWLNHLKANSQIKPLTVQLLMDRCLALIETSDITDRILHLLPHLMDLNPTPFRAKFNPIFETLLTQLRKSPAATMPLLSLAKLSVDQSDDRTILTRIRAELNQPPENDKWFSISLVKCLHHLTPFDPNLGVNRIPILESVATSNYSEENRMQSLKMLGLIKFEAFLNFIQDNELSVTYELLILIKSMILNPNNENAGHEFDIKDFDEIQWHKMAIETIKSFKNEEVQSFQKILSKFPSGLGENIDASEIIHTQLELLDATVRAGFPLDEKFFFIKSATGGGVKANQISHFLQGHTFKINYAAASLLSSQIIKTNFETYQELFKVADLEINQQTAYQMALALFVSRDSNDDNIMVGISLLQELITSRGWESTSVIILERLLTSLGDLSKRIEVEEELIGRIKQCVGNKNEKVKIAAIKCVAKLAGSQHHQTAWNVLMEIIFGIENPETNQIQMAIGEAVVSLGTGKTPARSFEERNEEAKMRPEVIEEVIKRTFGNSKAKTNGTGIWLSGLVDFGIIESTEIQFEIYYGLISRLFLSPDESPFVAKSLRTLYQKMNEDDRKVALEGIKHIIRTNKAPNRKGQATEKTLSTKETTGLKELVRIMQDNKSDEFIFDFLALSVGSSYLSTVYNIPESTVNKCFPSIFVMLHHPHESIRATAKVLFTQLTGSRRIEQNLIPSIDYVIEVLNGSDGDYREAGARTLPKLFGYINPSNCDMVKMIDLWNITLRACDDTRDNVRRVATVAAKDLCSITVRIVSEGDSVPKWIDELITLIINDYIESVSTPSVIIGISILHTWVKNEKALPLLLKHASRMVPILIQKSAITEQINVSKGNTRNTDYASMEKDTMEATKSSPFIEILLRLLESDKCPRNILEESAPLIGQLIKRGIGINARGMAIYVAGRISLKWTTNLVNSVGKMMAPLMPLMVDSSEPLRNECASAMPFLVSSSSEKTKHSFLQKIEKLYFDARNENNPNVIGRVLARCINKFDNEFYPFVGPLVWLGISDQSDGTYFNGIWDEGLFNIRHIGKEIVELASNGVESNSWDFRNQSLEALESLSKTGHLDPELVSYYLKILEKKYFNGKESVFRGICNLVSQLKSEEKKSDILKLLLEETKTGTNTYRKLLYKEIEDLIDSFDAASKTHSKDFVAQFISTENENLKCEELESLNTKLLKWI